MPRFLFALSLSVLISPLNAKETTPSLDMMLHQIDERPDTVAKFFPEDKVKDPDTQLMLRSWIKTLIERGQDEAASDSDRDRYLKLIRKIAAVLPKPKRKKRLAQAREKTAETRDEFEELGEEAGIVFDGGLIRGAIGGGLFGGAFGKAPTVLAAAPQRGPSGLARSNVTDHQSFEISVEDAPTHEQEDHTLWGHNQPKLARYRGRHFSYVMSGPNVQNKGGMIELRTRAPDGTWAEGAKLYSSRPAPLLVDSKGGLHVLTHEPLTPREQTNGVQVGRLMHHVFPDAGKGDIAKHSSSIAIDSPGTETVNIRTGAAIDENDTIYAAFGVSLRPGMRDENRRYGHNVQLWTKKVDQPRWTRDNAGVRLGHDFYYPFVSAGAKSVGILPVMDDYGPHMYKIMLFQRDRLGWTQEMVADHSQNELAQKRAKLVEQSDLTHTEDGKLQGVYRTFLTTDGSGPAFTRFEYDGDKLTQHPVELPTDRKKVQWIRFAKFKGKDFLLARDNGRIYIRPLDGADWERYKVPEGVTFWPPYVAGPMSGTRDDGQISFLLNTPKTPEHSGNHFVTLKERK